MNSLLSNKEIEKDMLSVMLKNRKTALNGVLYLSKDDFTEQMNRLIFLSCFELFKKNLPIEPVLVIAEMEFLKIEKAREFITDIVKKRLTTHNEKGLIDKLKEMTKRRMLKAYAQKIIETVSQESNYKSILSLLQMPPVFTNEENPIYTMESLIKGANERLIERRDSPHKIHGVETGFRDLDIITGGLMPKEMTVLGARPSIGKSVFAMDIARHASRKGNHVIYFSLEMGKEQLTDRGISGELKINADKIKYPQSMKKDDLDKLARSQIEIDLQSLYIVEQSDITIAEIRAKCIEAKLLRDKLDLIIVDYLQYMDGVGFNKREIVENNSKGLKQIAKDLNIHVLCISSLSRASEITAGRRPGLVGASSCSPMRPAMSDLRESGQIEYDADNIILMHRDRLGDSFETSRTELLLEKQRNGRTGIIYLTFQEKYVTFENAKSK